MVKVTITPEKTAVSVAPATLEVHDLLGRTLSLKKPGVLAQFRLVEALGDSARNEVYMGMVLPLLFLEAIDGVAVPAPSSKGEVEALIQRLDEPGIQTLMTAIPQHFGAEAQGDAVKKSAE